MAPGVSQPPGPPDHSVSSLICSRSTPTSPNTIAPRRPLPTGSASTHLLAARPYQSAGAGRRGGVTDVAGACAAPASGVNDPRTPSIGRAAAAMRDSTN